MAEVILPPIETEPEIPEEQLPEVEKPTEQSKVISVNFNPLNTKQTASLDTRESFYTTDTDAWIVLNVGDMNEPTGQYSLALINKEDGSIFQRTGDIVQGVAYYKLLPNEIKHAGRWVGQAVITLDNGQTTASRFSFNVSGHILDGKDVREIVIQDFQTLMAQLNDLKDNSTNEFGLLKNEIEAFQIIVQENEDGRQATELGRVAAEIIREENYESKVTAAIVEADVVEKVDNKVAELAPTIQQVTAQLAKTEQTLNGRLDTIIALPDGSTSNDARLEDIKVGADGKVYESPGSAVRTQISELDDDLTGFKNDISTLKKSKNLLNLSDENFRKNHFVSPTTGTLNASDSYDTSGFMPVSPGAKIIKTNMVTGNRVKRSMRFIASFDDSLDIMPTSGSNADVTDFVIPDGVAYVVVSYANRSDFTEPMIAELDISDNSIPPYEPYYKPYYDTTVKTDKSLSTLNIPADAKAVGDAFADVNRNISPYKNPSEVKKSSTLGANIPLVITDFPEMLKTGQRFSFSAKFDTFSAEDKIEVGFMKSAYATYQSWLEISSDRVKWMLSGTNPILNNLHALTLSKFVHVTVEVTTDTGQLKIMITTLGGSYTFTQTSDSTRFNAIGTLTAKASIATTDVVLSGTCTQFQCDTWLTGDSYFGSGPARIGGKLMEWGYSDGVLIDGLGGLNSVQAYGELQKLLKYGTPKTLVWYLGMNDNATTVASHFPLVEQLCDQNGIELIFNRIPLVPSRLAENNAVNTYVMASGRRYIDSYSAVGADTSGSWYAGHLNSDGVHPDPLGASALTSRLVADVPEILSMS